MAHIRTFARLKPGKNLYDEYEVTPSTLQIRTPEVFRDYGSPVRFRANVKHEFQFDKVFNVESAQDAVFDGVARDIIEGFLNGYNGTIFAYGQTGTGKTYTVEGSARRYSDRGLAPRALSMIYKSLESRTEEEITAHISYIEIYQEVAYDLLNPGARTFSPVTPLPKIGVIEGPGGSCLMRNLSVHLAASEEVAQSLLLQGETNRKVAETPVNQRSSRSHAVFTIYLSAKQPDSDVITRSKLHLVDLAGSERVAKTGVDGQQLTEAKSINLSLHHLESVIVSLQGDNSESLIKPRPNTSQPFGSPLNGRPSSSDGFRARKHVPYRNSLLTMVLRDSLGGNCLTAMIATVSLEVCNIGETLSTCRFAQRVACISNHAVRNEEIDDKTLIRKLKKKVSELEAEIAFLKLPKDGGCSDEVMNSKLTDEDKLHCAHVVHEYLGGRLMDPVTAGITDPYKFRECLRLLKKMVLSGYFNTGYERQEKTRVGPNVPAEGNKSVQILRISHDEDVVHGVDDVPLNPPPPVRPTQAWGDNSVPQARQVYRQAKSPSAVRTSVSSPSQKYKSPYERKRTRDIQRLSRRINTLQSSYEMKENHLSQFQHSVQLEELQVMESGIRAKLSVTKDQICHQQAYVAQLHDTEAGSELLGQEKLVERQLRKRQAKFEKKIEELEERKQQFQQDGSSSTPASPVSPSKVPIEEKFGQYRKHDGSLNTRQVFDMLKMEEKKTQKAEAELEKEKILTMSRQLEVREAATRQKLRDLKQMIRISQDPKQNMEDEVHRSGGGDRQLSSSKSNSGQHRHRDLHPTTEQENTNNWMNSSQARYDSKDFDRNTNSRTPNVNDNDIYSSTAQTGVGQTLHDSRGKSKHGDFKDGSNPRPVSAKSFHSVRSVNVPDSGFYAARKSSADGAASKWDSAYSTRPSTAETRPATADVVEQNQTTKPNSLPNSNISNSIALEPGNMFTNGAATIYSNSETLMPSEYVYGMADGDKFDGRRMGLSSKTFEAALSSMLDKDETANYSNEYYNQFARSGKHKNPSPSHKRSGNRRITQDKDYTTAKILSSWGPEAKSSPIAAKLAMFLQDLDDNTTKTGSHSTHPVSLPPDTHADKQKIKALSEGERETTFMSKAETERRRISKIRKARRAAEIIQKAWRRRHNR